MMVSFRRGCSLGGSFEYPNNIGDEGAKALGEALKSNNTLTTLK
jgi:hypothetical protein